MPESQELMRFEANLDAMGSTYSVVLYGDRYARMEEAANAAEALTCGASSAPC